MREKLGQLLDLLGNLEEPLGIAYTDAPPPDALTPGGNGHACIINYARMARAQKKPAYFSADVQGCGGGWVYLGFLLPPPPAIAEFVTTGLPGREGERYMPAPESMRRFFDALDMRPAPAPYCVIQPLSLFAGERKPQFVVFYARGEALTGLCQLAYFTLDDHDAVALPFGAGCSNILSWPLHYQRRGIPRAVLGGVDPSCRPFMKVDELSFTVPFEVFEAMLEAAPRSFLTTKTWAGVRKRIEKSNKIWDTPSARPAPGLRLDSPAEKS